MGQYKERSPIHIYNAKPFDPFETSQKGVWKSDYGDGRYHVKVEDMEDSVATFWPGDWIVTSLSGDVLSVWSPEEFARRFVAVGTLMGLSRFDAQRVAQQGREGTEGEAVLPEESPLCKTSEIVKRQNIWWRAQAQQCHHISDADWERPAGDTRCPVTVEVDPAGGGHVHMCGPCHFDALGKFLEIDWTSEEAVANA